jgi:hypothetical protein
MIHIIKRLLDDKITDQLTCIVQWWNHWTNEERAKEVNWLSVMERMREQGKVYIEELRCIDDYLCPPPDQPTPPPPPNTPGNGAVGLDIIELPRRFPEPPTVLRRFNIAA